jgi:hypothetical protein
MSAFDPKQAPCNFRYSSEYLRDISYIFPTIQRERGISMKSFVVSFLCACLFSIQVAAQDTEPSWTLITNVNIFDGLNDGLMPGDVLIENNLITEIGPNLNAPSEAIVIDGGGRTLMPGLIDSHVHFNLSMDGGRQGMESSRWGIDKLTAALDTSETGST